LVDTRDLKSLGIIYRAGSTPALGTRFEAFGQLILRRHESLNVVLFRAFNLGYTSKPINCHPD
jgi:hypothetical protein